MSLASSRERRKNAGHRMSNLINDEEDNEFYKSAYGGFEDDHNDDEFMMNEDEIEEDYVDSDFDIDENEDNDASVDNEDESEEKKEKKKIVYASAEVKKAANPIKKIKTIKIQKTADADIAENKTLRTSTALKRKELELRQKEREERKVGKMRRSLHDNQRLTQEELLAEAAETEKINLASLDAYHKLELAKKKTKFVKNALKGPTIRYHSTLMPVFKENEIISTEAKNNEEKSKQIRNFVVFSDEKTLNEHFPKSEPITAHKKFCIITGLPAKYFDPVTQCPYANLYAFKIIRDLYQKQNAKT